MQTSSFERVVASWIYFLLGGSTAHIFLIGLTNGLASGYRYPIQQKLLIGAALTGAATLLGSGILVYFRPPKAYLVSMFALPLLLLAFWPLVDIVIHQGYEFGRYSVSDLLAAVLLPVAVVFTPLRLVRLHRSKSFH